MSAAWGVLLAALVQQGVVMTDPPCEIALPTTYRRSKAGDIVRQVGPEDWTTLRMSYAPASGPMAQPAGTLTQADALALAQLPKDATLAFEAKPWKEFQVGIFITKRVVGTLPTVGLQAVVPLHPKALLLTLEGAEPLEKDLRSDLDMILAGLTGRCTWRTPEEIRRARTADRLDLAGAALAVTYALVWVLYFRSHFMTAHWLRVAWLLATAVVLILPSMMRSEIGMLQIFLNLAVPLGVLGFVGRRLKMAVEFG